MRPQLSTTAWKWLISTLALSSALMLVMEFTQSIKPLLIDGQYGSLGIGLNDQLDAGPYGQGTHVLRIETLGTESPLLAAGAKPGDRLKFDRYEDRWRKFAVDETVGLTLYKPSGAQHVTASAQAVPASFSDYVDYWGRFLLAVPALLFSLMIGFKQAEGRAYRALSIAFIVLSLMFHYTFNFSSTGPAYTIGKLANLTTYVLIWYWCAEFLLHYQAFPQGGLRAWLARRFSIYRALAFLTAAYAMWFGLGHEAPLLSPLIFTAVISGLLIVAANLIDGWRHSGGEIRQRHLWLLLSFAIGSIPAILTLIPALDWNIHGMRATVILMFAGQLAMYIGLAYAVLRHRVFNFDFAISRALIFSVISVLLLSAFGVIEWLSESLLHSGEAEHGNLQQQSLLLDAGVALSVYLIFHQVHGKIERALEKFLFHKWHDNEHKLREYVWHAAHITAVDPLLESLRTAMDRFTAQAGCAIYLKHADGHYQLVVNSLERAPAALDSNDEIAVALRSDMEPILPSLLQSAVRGELVLPMSHRGALNGFVILGSKPKGESYRPDECDVLGFATQQIGLDLHALRVLALEHELQQLAKLAETQKNELQLMAGRRKNVRELFTG